MDLDADAVLRDPTFVVPTPPAGPGAMAWLRSHVARFSAGDVHARRRRLVTDLLDPLDPAHLRTAARKAAGAGTPHDRIPAQVLTVALGLPGAVDLVATAASGYLPGGAGGPRIDAAVSALRARVTGCPAAAGDAPGPDDEAVAARIGVLLQAHGATAALIRAAAERDGDVAAALREDPPARSTRRLATRAAHGVHPGALVTVPLSGDLAFGAGAHACPGRAAALAIVEGALAGGSRAARSQPHGRSRRHRVTPRGGLPPTAWP